MMMLKFSARILIVIYFRVLDNNIMQKIILVGGSGYLGGRITEAFLNYGHEIKILTRNDFFYKNYKARKNLTIIKTNYDSVNLLSQLMKGSDVVMHLASPKADSLNELNRKKIIEKHIILTKLVSDAANISGVSTFIYFSTIHVYGQNLKGVVCEDTTPKPLHPYGIQHLEAEKIILSQKMKSFNAIILRISNTYGIPYFPNDYCWKLMVNNFCKEAIENKKIIIKSSGNDYRNIISIINLIEFLNFLVEEKYNFKMNEIFNIGGGETLKIIEVAELIKNKLFSEYDYRVKIDARDDVNDVHKGHHYFEYSIDKIINKIPFNIENDNKELDNLLHYHLI